MKSPLSVDTICIMFTERRVKEANEGKVFYIPGKRFLHPC